MIFKKIRAVCAAGIVFGIGTTVTLAAWNDSEFAGGKITSGKFDIEGSTNGSSFTDSTATAEHILNFAPDALAIAPGISVYAPFSVRTKTESVAGRLNLLPMPGNNNELGQSLRYSVKLVSSHGCNESVFNGSSQTVVPENSPLDSAGTTPFNLQANSGNTAHHCFKITLPQNADNSSQGKSATPKWQFLGTTD